MDDPKRQFIGYIVCLVAFAFIAWSFYPGLMTADSIANLTQGRTDSYSDINAPLMSWVWGRLDTIVPGPALIFVIHLAIFWAACGLFWRASSTKSFWLGIALVVFGLAPHILAQTVVVWKDVALGVSLFMTVALLYFSRTTGSRIALFISPLFLFYGFAARLNAIPAVLPIAIWTGYVVFEVFEIGTKKLAPLALGLGYFAVVFVGVYFVNDRLTDARTEYPFQQVYLYDLAAISVAKNEAVFPEYVPRDPAFSLETVKSRYNERSVADLIYPDVPNVGNIPPFKLSRDAKEIGDLQQAWVDAITKEPLAYLRHRANVFAQLIGLRWSITAPFVADGYASNPAEFRGSENLGYVVLMKYLRAFRRPVPQTLFFRAIVWIGILGVLAYMATKRRLSADWDLVFVLAASSLLFIFAYFPTTPSTEFRYLFWPAIATAVAMIFGIYLWGSEVRR